MTTSTKLTEDRQRRNESIRGTRMDSYRVIGAPDEKQAARVDAALRSGAALHDVEVRFRGAVSPSFIRARARALKAGA